MSARRISTLLDEILQLVIMFQYVLDNGVQFSGAVKLNGAENEFHIIEYYNGDHEASTREDGPECIYFGRLVSSLGYSLRVYVY